MIEHLPVEAVVNITSYTFCSRLVHPPARPVETIGRHAKSNNVDNEGTDTILLVHKLSIFSTLFLLFMENGQHGGRLVGFIIICGASLT